MSDGWDDVETRRMDMSQPAIALDAVGLLVIEGPDRGKRARLASGVTRIGTSASNQLCLTDRAVSRMHCEIRVRKEGVHVRDGGSTNGTSVDGVRIVDAMLLPGSTITLGVTAILIESTTEPLRVAISMKDSFGGVLGGSLAMRRVYAIMERLAATDATALIQGETGTGKELVARAVHEASSRKRGPFVAVDCGAIAETLIESELFGHARGSFSGAHADRRGLFEAAQGGTIFLDEIGELPLSLQPKLLRAIEAREVRRVGENVGRPFDVRILAATHRSLADRVNEGSFREDLYYRLAVIELEVPPLRARRDDIATLAQGFYARFSGTEDALPASLLPALESRAWPGNVRELRNFVERMVSFGAHEETASAPLEGAAAPSQPASAVVAAHLPLREARLAWTEQFERLYVEELLRRTNGNVTRAAEIAGVHRRSMQRLIASLGGRLGDLLVPGDWDAGD